jgi:hemerythrin-like metal-binding protein
LGRLQTCGPCTFGGMRKDRNTTGAACARRIVMLSQNLVWQETVGRIRKEHEELHHSTARFLDQVRQNQPISHLIEAMRHLTQHLKLHFETEEQLMRRASFPGLHTHRLLHEACMNQFRLETDFLGLGQVRSLDEYEEMIHTWITEHMRMQDRRFEDFIGSGVFTRFASSALPDGCDSASGCESQGS